MKHPLKLSAALAVAALAATSPAYAGGLFGDGGLIRGSVGDWLDENVEGPITTPLARQATVAAGTAVGTYYGGPIGGVAGGIAGNYANDCFRGDCSRSFRAARDGGGGYPQPPAYYGYSYPAPRYQPSYGYGYNPYQTQYGYGSYAPYNPYAYQPRRY